jgi:hypothetical protein
MVLLELKIEEEEEEAKTKQINGEDFCLDIKRFGEALGNEIKL